MNTSKESEYEMKMRRIERAAMVLLTGASVITAIYCHTQLKKAVRLMSKAAESVSDLTVVDVQRDVINRAIEHATNREVGKAVCRAMSDVEHELTRETQRRVRTCVEQNYGKLQKAVTDAIAREAAKVDKDDVMREATERAKDLIVEKFDGKLDGLLEDYNRNLENVGKIYQSIASSMADKKGKDVTLNLG